MPRVFNFGSLNIDYVYKAPHFVRGGETLAASERTIHAGGKGLNQSIALARAGLDVAHVGVIGEDGEFLKDMLEREGVDVSRIRVDKKKPTGHTVIQVTPSGENAILYFAGANKALKPAYVRKVLDELEADDLVMLQNETSAVKDIIKTSVEKGLRVIFNPAPFDPSVNKLPLDHLYALFVNVTEACGILGIDPAVYVQKPYIGRRLLLALAERFPKTIIVLTEGSFGAGWVVPDGEKGFTPAFYVDPVDTTGAGDTFAGYAVRGIVQGEGYKKHSRLMSEEILNSKPETDDTQQKALWEAMRGIVSVEVPGSDAFLFSGFFENGLRIAAMAAALSVTKPGAAESIPKYDEVIEVLNREDEDDGFEEDPEDTTD